LVSVFLFGGWFFAFLAVFGFQAQKKSQKKPIPNQTVFFTKLNAFAILIFSGFLIFSLNEMPPIYSLPHRLSPKKLILYSLSR
jgi:hypothetical protein